MGPQLGFHHGSSQEVATMASEATGNASTVDGAFVHAHEREDRARSGIELEREFDWRSLIPPSGLFSFRTMELGPTPPVHSNHVERIV